jgi:hypothetical protein
MAMFVSFIIESPFCLFDFNMIFLLHERKSYPKDGFFSFRRRFPLLPPAFCIAFTRQFLPSPFILLQTAFRKPHGMMFPKAYFYRQPADAVEPVAKTPCAGFRNICKSGGFLKRGGGRSLSDSGGICICPI